MGKKSPQPIGEVLKNVVEGLNQTKTQEIARIYSRWSNIVGKELFQHTRPASLRRGTLLVNVDDSAWFYQVNLQKEKLLQVLQKKKSLI